MRLSLVCDPDLRAILNSQTPSVQSSGWAMEKLESIWKWISGEKLG
jgi:hypothetical protein